MATLFQSLFLFKGDVLDPVLGDILQLKDHQKDFDTTAEKAHVLVTALEAIDRASGTIVDRQNKLFDQTAYAFLVGVACLTFYTLSSGVSIPSFFAATVALGATGFGLLMKIGANEDRAKEDLKTIKESIAKDIADLLEKNYTEVTATPSFQKAIKKHFSNVSQKTTPEDKIRQRVGVQRPDVPQNR